MSRQYWVAGLPPFNTADGTAYSTSTTVTEVSPLPQIVLPAGILETGSTLRLTAAGRYSTTGTPTLIVGFYLNSTATVLAATSAITTISGAANTSWRCVAEARLRTPGTTGTIFTEGTAYGLPSTTGISMMPASAPATQTIDTTGARSLLVAATWGTNSASNTLTCHHFMVELLN